MRADISGRMMVKSRFLCHPLTSQILTTGYSYKRSTTFENTYKRFANLNRQRVGRGFI